MRLESKGEIRPPPRLKGPAQSVSLEIQSWRGIIAATHWFLHDRTQVDGADFYVGEKELGHIHLDGELHLFVTVGLRRRLIEASLAEALPWAEDCVQAPISSRREARNALWLFRLAYDRLRGTPIADLRRRIALGCWQDMCARTASGSQRAGRSQLKLPGPTSIRLEDSA